MGFAEAIPAPEALFSLHRAGHRVTLLHRAGVNRPLLALADGAVAVPDPKADAAGAIATIRAAMADHDLAYALDDDMLLLMTEGGAASAEVSVHATGARARAALDKRIQIEAARAAGLAVPETLVLEGPAPDAALPPLPGIAKPARAAALEGGRLAPGGAHYLADAAAARALAADPGPAPLLFQPLIRGVGEGVFGFAHEGGITAWSGHRRLRMMNPHGSGSSACVSVIPDEALRAACGRMMRALGWHGPFMLEFLRAEDGTPWFMELNGRLWGSLALARRLGHDHPAWAVRQALEPGFAPDAPPAQAGLVARSLAREALYPLFVARGPKSAFHREGWPGLAGAIRAAWAPGRRSGFYGYDPSAPGFFLRDALWELRRKVRGR